MVFHYELYFQLLKIERVSDTGVKQTCISEVSFTSLVAMPESESTLPKLSFPKETPRKKEKVGMGVYSLLQSWIKPVETNGYLTFFAHVLTYRQVKKIPPPPAGHFSC